MNILRLKNICSRPSFNSVFKLFNKSRLPLTCASENASKSGLNHTPMVSIDFTNVPKRTIGLFPSTREYLKNLTNSIRCDLSKVVEYNKITRPYGKFLVIDKAKSKATLYKGDKIVASFDVGVGETFGDSLNSVSYDYATKTFGKVGKTTPSGEFRTSVIPESCVNKSDYITNGKTNLVLLNGVMHPANYGQNTSLALHQLPNHLYEQRLQILNSPIQRKGISTGCINFKTEDFQILAQQLPEGTPVYILPEEVGNSLKLIELPDEKLWFRTQYNDNERNNILEMAINKYFGFNQSAK